MALNYKSYAAVAKTQAYLEELKDAGDISYAKSLKEADGGFDGKWGPDTDNAFWAWVGTLETGSDLSALVSEGVITSAELATLDQAIKENNDILAGKTGGSDGGGSPKTPDPLPGDVPGIPPGAGIVQSGGWSTTTWLLIGVTVAAAGVAGWYWMKKPKGLPAMRPARARARATAGLDDLDDGGSVGGTGGCGCGG